MAVLTMTTNDVNHHTDNNQCGQKVNMVTGVDFMTHG